MTIHHSPKKKTFIYKIFICFIFTLTLIVSAIQIGCCQIDNENIADSTKYTLTYNANDGSDKIKNITGSKGTEITLEANSFIKIGYTFGSWNTNADGSGTGYADKTKIKLTANITLYAQWVANTYTVIFDANGGSGKVPDAISAVYDKDFELPNNSFTKPDYKFEGWNTRADGSGKNYTAKVNEKNLTAKNGGIVKLYARWVEEGAFSITYELSDGEHVGTPRQSFKETEDVTLGMAVRKGYSFDGWYETKDLTGNKVEGWNAGERTTEVTLYAKWIANTYTVTFDANADDATGKVPDDISAVYDEEIDLPGNPFTKPDYKFAAWNTSADGSGTDYAAEAKEKNLTEVNGGTIKLYARWIDAESYSIAYVLNGGEHAGTPKQSFKDTEDVTLGSAERLGCTFGGWYETKDLTGNKIEGWKAGTKKNEVILYAKWTENTYTVKFDKNADDATGNVPADITATYDVKTKLPDNPFTKKGYTFSGWNTIADGSGDSYQANAQINLSADITLYAQWVANAYTVEFNLNGGIGNIPDDILTAYDKEFDLPDNSGDSFARIGYTFSNWNTSADGSGTNYAAKAKEKNITEENNVIVTLYAKWAANTYTVTFDANGGNGNAPDAISAVYDKEFDLPDNTFTKMGYTFGGWNTNADGSGTDYAAKAKEKNITEENNVTVMLYAQWIENDALSITYELSDGEHVGSPTKQFKVTENVTLGEAKRIGYAFGGWYEAQDFSGNAIAAWNAGEKTENVILYAKWTANSYTVKFDANGGKGNAPSAVSAVYDKEFDLPDNTFTKIGYTFDGWNTEADGSGTDYATKAKNLTTENGVDVMLYAQWTANTYTVTFDFNGELGEYTYQQTFTYGKPQVLSSRFNHNNRKLLGWATTAAGSVAYKDGEEYSIGAENVTLYAVWQDVYSFRLIYGCEIEGTEKWNPSSKVFISGRKFHINPYRMCDHEVTRAEWKEVMGNDPSKADAYDTHGNKIEGDAAKNNPVDNVSWYDAIVYCNKRSIREGLTPCYTIDGLTNPDHWGAVPTSSNTKWNAVTCNFEANGYRLPTEAEWERAARGGYGNIIYAGGKIDNAWYQGNTKGTRPVKSKLANYYGLYDLGGNVFEWCWDRYGTISTDTPATGSPSGELRCRRGGSWFSGERFCTVAERVYHDPSTRSSSYGLRVVRFFSR